MPNSFYHKNAEVTETVSTHARAVNLAIASSTAAEFRPHEANTGASPIPTRLPPILDRNWRFPHSNQYATRKRRAYPKPLLHMCDRDRNYAWRRFLELNGVWMLRFQPFFSFNTS